MHLFYRWYDGRVTMSRLLGCFSVTLLILLTRSSSTSASPHLRERLSLVASDEVVNLYTPEANKDRILDLVRSLPRGNSSVTDDSPHQYHTLSPAYFTILVSISSLAIYLYRKSMIAAFSTGMSSLRTIPTKTPSSFGPMVS